MVALLEQAAPHGYLAGLVTDPVMRLVLDLYPPRTSTGDAGS